MGLTDRLLIGPQSLRDRSPVMSEKTILVLDDDATAHILIEGLLKRDGYAFAHASSAAEAFRILEAISIELVICDAMMPETDGFEVCRVVKSHETWRTIPILMVTALDGQDDMVRGLEAGADEFLSKPVDKVVLRARVHALLRIREQYQELAHGRPRDLDSLVKRRRQDLAECFAPQPRSVTDAKRTPCDAFHVLMRRHYQIKRLAAHCSLEA